MTTRRIVIMSTIAALYAAATVALGPISFGPLQFRAANLLVALMFYGPEYCLGIGLGVFFGKLASPFGPLDWAIMPVVSFLGAHGGWHLRRMWPAGVVLWAAATSSGVSIFPLWLGAGIDPRMTILPILVAQLAVGFAGRVLFAPFGKLFGSVKGDQ